MTSPTISTARRVQLFAPALIAVLVVATIQPLVVVTATLLPLHFDEAPWRVRMAGLLLGAAPQLGVGLAVIGAVGLFGGFRRAVRGAAVAAVVLAVMIVVLLVIDAFDVFQVRRMVPQDRLHGFDVNAMQTFGIAAVLVPILLWAGIQGWQAGFPEAVSRTRSGRMVAVPGADEVQRRAPKEGER